MIKYIVRVNGRQHIIQATSMDDAAITVADLYRIFTSPIRVLPLSVFHSVYPHEVVTEQQVIITESARQVVLNTVEMR